MAAAAEVHAPPVVDTPAEAQYRTGQKATVWNPDGSGFAYYPSGRVAVVVGRVSDKYQRYFYEDDERNTLIGTMDENVVGFAFDHTDNEDGLRLVTTKKGATDNNSCRSSDAVVNNYHHHHRQQGGGGG